MAKSTEYEGWKNKATWNVALWINNDEYLYKSAVQFMKTYKGRAPYAAFIKKMYMKGEFTPDRFKWDGQALDYKALNEMMREL